MTGKSIDVFVHRLEQLLDQLARVAETPFYREHFESVDPTAVSSLDEFVNLPLLDTEDLLTHYETSTDDPAFFSDDVRQINMTPAGDRLMPEYNTEYDLEESAKYFGDLLQAQGVGPGQVALNCTGYTTFIGGLASHFGLQAAGAAVYPAGPGDAERTAGVAQQLDADVILANPSFGLEIAEHADIELDVFVGGGEPLVSVPGLREDLREAFGGNTTVVDNYGLSEILPVASECRHEDGLHVSDEYVLAEVIDPETEDNVAPGERGELVLTHLQKEAMPLVRYRTGDLTTLVESECACGRSISLPDGVFGRVDNRKKVKGVKFYPDSIGTVLPRFPGLSGEFRVEITRPQQTDHLTVAFEAEDPTAVDTDELRGELETEMLISPDKVELVEDLELDTRVVDRRYDD